MAERVTHHVPPAAAVRTVAGTSRLYRTIICQSHDLP